MDGGMGQRRARLSPGGRRRRRGTQRRWRTVCARSWQPARLRMRASEQNSSRWLPALLLMKTWIWTFGGGGTESGSFHRHVPGCRKKIPSHSGEPLIEPGRAALVYFMCAHTYSTDVRSLRPPPPNPSRRHVHNSRLFNGAGHCSPPCLTWEHNWILFVYRAFLDTSPPRLPANTQSHDSQTTRSGEQCSVGGS